MSLSLKIARQELRGALRAMRVFVICLALGVAAIAMVASLRGTIANGLQDQGATLLGGDAEITLTYRLANPEELEFLTANSQRLSSVLDFRSMAITPDVQALTQVKAVDNAWPLYGEARLEPPMPMAEALKGKDGLPGAVMEPALLARMDLKVGQKFSLGAQEFVLMAALTAEPDAASAGFGLGPRTVVGQDAVKQSGLIGPGALYDTRYRMALAPEQDLKALRQKAETALPNSGMRWRDSRNGAPGMQRFIDNMGSFLVLVGLAGLATGGVGISTATKSWITAKTKTIATLKTLGASSGLILRIYLWQILLLSAIGIAIGLMIGAIVPYLAAPFLIQALPFDIEVGLSARALIEAGFYGVMVVLIFTLLPLAQAQAIRPAALYRGMGLGRPRPIWLILVAILVAVLVVVATFASGLPLLAFATTLAIAFVLGILALAAIGVQRLARHFSSARLIRGRPALHLALSAIGSPRSEAVPVILALGLGLSVLSAIGQIDSNIRQAIALDVPKRAPAFFMVDIQPDQIEPFRQMAADNTAITDIDTAPMLRGVVAKINGRPAREVAGTHWVVRGDRGISYAAAPPKDTKITDGVWWADDYSGPPQISMAAKEAAEIGIGLGDKLTLNILGREIEGEITSLREVNFTQGGIGFVIILNEAALRGAPHSHIATIYAPPEAETAILRDVTKNWPNITTISIRDTITRVQEAMDAVAIATAWAAMGSLLTGFAVLIGTAAAGQTARNYEAAILKTLGATRAKIWTSFALRMVFLGAAAGVIAVAAGSLSAWGVMTFVMEGTHYRFAAFSAATIIIGGILATTLAGGFFAKRALDIRPARQLRAND